MAPFCHAASRSSLAPFCHAPSRSSLAPFCHAASRSSLDLCHAASRSFLATSVMRPIGHLRPLVSCSQQVILSSFCHAASRSSLDNSVMQPAGYTVLRRSDIQNRTVDPWKRAQPQNTCNVSQVAWDLPVLLN